MSEQRSFKRIQDEAFSRERAAGYDPAIMEKMVVVVAGAGAAGNNIALNLSLSGAHELRIIDMDRIDPSNYARSPGFSIMGAGANASKAQTLARAAAKLNPRRDAVVRYAHNRIEALGMGAFAGASVVVSAVDANEARAYLSDVTRFLGIPMVEIGFRYPRGHVAVYGNRSDEAQCWRCREPNVTPDRHSCEVYAGRLVLSGIMPATQTLAAATGAFVTEACVRLAHGDTSLDDTFTDIDLRTFTAERMRLVAAESCPGMHLRAAAIMPVDVDYKASVERFLEAVSATVKGPILRLPSPYVVSAPCVRCGAPVSVGAPRRSLEAAPACASCAAVPRDEPAPFIEASEISTDGSLLKSIALRRLGYRPHDVLRVVDEQGGIHAFRLQGSADALYHTVTARGAPATSEGAQAESPAST